MLRVRGCDKTKKKTHTQTPHQTFSKISVSIPLKNHILVAIVVDVGAVVVVVVVAVVVVIGATVVVVVVVVIDGIGEFGLSHFK